MEKEEGREEERNVREKAEEGKGGREKGEGKEERLKWGRGSTISIH